MVEPIHDSRAAARSVALQRGVTVVAPYLLVLLATALVGIAVAARSADAFHDANALREFPEPARRTIAFGLVFNVATAMALAAAWLGELIAVPIRLGKRLPAPRVLARFGVACLPPAAFAVGHVVVNPWLLELAKQAKSATGQ